MLDYQIRVTEELERLNDKINKLVEFKTGPVFQNLDPIDQNLLISQLEYMSNYSSILAVRISRFGNAT